MGTSSFTPTKELLAKLGDYIASDALQIVMTDDNAITLYAVKNGVRLLEYGPLSLLKGDTLTVTGITINAIDVGPV